MSDASALRFLELVRQRLAAADARIEIGGSPPVGDDSVWVALNADRRVVAVFEGAPPEDAANTLIALVDAFSATAEAPPSDGPAALARRTLPTEIDAELNGLCVRARAVAAVLVDASSPVVWGRSHAEIPDEIDAMLELAESVGDADPGELVADSSRWPALLREGAAGSEASARRLLVAAVGIRLARAAAAAEPRSVGSFHRTDRYGSFTFMTRSVAGVYFVILGFEGGFSEPGAEGVLQRGHSALEHLIVKLPPTDPPPEGRVLALRRPGDG